MQRIIMGNFAQATEYDVHMHAKFEDSLLPGFLQINTSSFGLLEKLIIAIVHKIRFGQP
jgi:hypothetical protein